MRWEEGGVEDDGDVRLGTMYDHSPFISQLPFDLQQVRDGKDVQKV